MARANPEMTGNIRDAATIEQLVVLSNLESINAVLIHQGLPQLERLQQLNSIAITQMKSMLGNIRLKKFSNWFDDLPADPTNFKGLQHVGLLSFRLPRASRSGLSGHFPANRLSKRTPKY